MDDYDVFLNHRGLDVKGRFIAHLYDALRSAGLNPFLDKKSLVKGAPAFRSIDDALEVAKIHVAVVTRGYAESKHCLGELVAMMRSGKTVIPVFYDVEPAELRWVEKGPSAAALKKRWVEKSPFAAVFKKRWVEKSPFAAVFKKRWVEKSPFAAAFQKHKSRETVEQVQEWADALHKLAGITGFVFRLSDYNGDEAELKREVMDAILSLLPSKEAVQVQNHLFGLREQVKICINKLENMSHVTSFLCFFGMGGIGKTTLAKEIYNHLIGHKKFQAMSFLEIDRTSSSMEVGLSSLNRLQKQLLWDLMRVPDNDQHNYKYWFDKISSQGPVLVVLDDIQDKIQFDKLILNTNLLASGSSIIVTSRDRHLLRLIAGKSNFFFYEVIPLGYKDSQKLFNWHAFGDEEAPENFKALATDVSKACTGLPLALKVVGSSLFDKISDEDRECIWPEAIRALKGNKDIMNALKWSFNCLSKAEKLMFVDIACMFHGWKKEEALKIWQSCKECSACCSIATPHTSLKNLIDKSLVVLESTPSGYVLAMHGLLQDMGKDIGMVDKSHLWKDNATKAIAEDENQDLSKVRALNLTNSGQYNFDFENFAKMKNLHFLILDGCNVSGNLGSISKELRCLQWKHMPLMNFPSMLNLSKLITLDFSQSSKLINIWTESNPALEACPNLQRLNLSECTSITVLPDSIGLLSQLQVLDLQQCRNLQKLPNSIGQLTTLQVLNLWRCGSLEALPDTITTLSGLQRLYMESCLSISNLPTTFGLMKSITNLNIDLATKSQVVGMGQLHALKVLLVRECPDNIITLLDKSQTLKNLNQLSKLQFDECLTMTKLPETMGLLTNLDFLQMWGCEKLQELPNSIGQLKMLAELWLRKCYSLESLPDSLGAMSRSLQVLYIVKCTSITELPPSIGHLSSLRKLVIRGCNRLQSLPDSLKQLNTLCLLEVMDCGSLEGLGLLGALRGLRIWGCTSITKLVGSCLRVVDSNIGNPDWFYDLEEWDPSWRNLEELQVVEENDCGYLHHVQDAQRRWVTILQRVHKMPCCWKKV